MKKNLLCWVVLCLLLGMGLCPVAQGADNYYEAFLEVNDQFQDYQIYLLRQAGATITGRYDGFLTVSVKDDVDPLSLQDIEGVEHVTKALTLLTSIDTSRYFSNVAPIHLGEGLEKPYLGTGVIVGLIDCGFDFNHINMFDSNGKSRVKAVYLPLDSGANPPVVNMVRLPGNCYENPADNKRYFYQLDGEGIRYEIVSFLKQVLMLIPW